MACRKAIPMALERQIPRVHVELDSKSVVQMINQTTRNLSPVGPWIQEIKEMLSSFTEYKVL